MRFSIKKIISPLNITAILFSLSLASCSGGGGGGTAAPTISGTAATGKALVGNVDIYGKNGGSILDIPIDTSGKYSADVTGLTPPYLICAEPDDTNSDNLYSYSGTSGTANVTPLTTLALYYANDEQDLAQLINTWSADKHMVS